MHFLNSPLALTRVKGLTGGSASPHLNVRDVKLFQVPLPPLAEQHRIVAEVERRLSVVDDMDKTVAHGLKRAARLRQAILRKAFAGELVPQDPEDEPASVLLERIRAERAAVENGRGPSGRGKRTKRPAQLRLVETAEANG